MVRALKHQRRCVTAIVGTTLTAERDVRLMRASDRLKRAGIDVAGKCLGGEPSEINDNMLKDGEVIFKANADNTDIDYIDPVQQYDTDRLNNAGARIVLNKVMTYQEYMDQYDSGRLTAIDPVRMVRVISVFHPGEYDTIRGGIYKNATVTGLNDAETGYYFGGFVQGEQVPVPTNEDGQVGPRGY